MVKRSGGNGAAVIHSKTLRFKNFHHHARLNLLAPRIELGWPYDRGILSPLRLPIPPREQMNGFIKLHRKNRLLKPDIGGQKHDRNYKKRCWKPINDSNSKAIR